MPADHASADDLRLLYLSRSTSLTGRLLRHAHEIPEATAIRFREDELTWAEYCESALRAASELAGRGVGAGDRVALLMTNRPEFLIATAATQALGAIVVPVNFRLTAPEVAYILDNTDPKALIVEGRLAELASDAVAAAACAPDVLDVDARALGAGADPLPVADIVIPRAEDDCAILHTSGTTGHPKGAVLSMLNVYSSALQTATTWDVDGGEGVVMLAPPLFHIGAFMSQAAALAAGCTALVIPSSGFDPAGTLTTMRESAVSAAFMVPQQWSLLCDEIERTGADLALTHANWGGAPATERLLRRMADLLPQAKITAVFGQTETTGTVVKLDFADSLERIGSVGKPTAETSIRIVDPMMNDVGVDEVGEIVYRGPSVMSRYWNDEAASAEAFAGGWFHSGDLVRRDAEGFVYVVDRLKDMIISGGENIYCAEIENALAWHPKVLEVSIVGRADDTWGEVPVACIVPEDPEDPPSLDEVREFLADRLSSYKHPKDVRILTSLPRSGMGKIQKPVLREAVR